MDDMNITEAEFKTLLAGFWTWTSKRPRTRCEWLLSLEDWTKVEYNDAFKADHKVVNMEAGETTT